MMHSNLENIGYKTINSFETRLSNSNAILGWWDYYSQRYCIDLLL